MGCAGYECKLRKKEKREKSGHHVSGEGWTYLTISTHDHTASLSLHCRAEMRPPRPMLLSKTARPRYTIEDCPLCYSGTLCTSALGREVRAHGAAFVQGVSVALSMCLQDLRYALGIKHAAGWCGVGCSVGRIVSQRAGRPACPGTAAYRECGQREQGPRVNGVCKRKRLVDLIQKVGVRVSSEVVCLRCALPVKGLANLIEYSCHVRARRLGWIPRSLYLSIQRCTDQDHYGRWDIEGER